MRAVIVIGILLLASSAGAQGRDRIELGEDAAVQRTYAPCWDRPLVRCAWWQPEGRLSFDERPELEQAITFARSSSGRIFAMIPAFAPWAVTGVSSPYPAGAVLLYSDDLGVSWSAARWPDSPLHAISIAFDPTGPTGVAVGPDGSVWSTEDDGFTWRRRRSSTGAGFREVWVRARTCVIEDTQGALWISRDRGFSLETLAPRGHVDDRGEELVVAAEGRTTRIDARGGVHRD